MIYKGYLGSHFDYLCHSSVNEQSVFDLWVNATDNDCV